MTDEMLGLLLDQSRQNNSRLGITGLLLYMEGRFLDRTEGRYIQLLEGPQATVQALYNRILTDIRHRSILLLETGYGDKRSFPRWSMGFRSADQSITTALAGFIQLDDSFAACADIPQSPGLLNYFCTFYEVNQADGLQRRNLRA